MRIMKEATRQVVRTRWHRFFRYVWIRFSGRALETRLQETVSGTP